MPYLLARIMINLMLRGLFLALIVAPMLDSAELLLPANPLERTGPVRVVFRAAKPQSGSGRLAVEWHDAFGRLVDRRAIPVEFRASRDTAFSLDLTRAVALHNELRATLSMAGQSEQAAATFLTPPPAGPWNDYQILMWQRATEAAYRTMRSLGISGGMYYGRERTPPEALLANGMPWYVENIATDFYSAYHRYFPDRPQGWLFDEAKRLYPRDAWKAFERKPSLSDPAALAEVRARLVETARVWSPYRPVFYDLGDETGIGELGSFWDFDLSAHSLAGMRKWLNARYGSLDALNRQWGTAYRNWDAVMPMTTNEAMKRRDSNLSAWSDFKEWMDTAFADALRMGAEAIRSVDPRAYVAIEGAQMPGWGGYDYTRLTGALNAVEAYDIGNNIEILRSLNPQMAILTTSFDRGRWEKLRVWYELLHGTRGLILWDEKNEFASPEGRPGARGLEAAPYFREIRDGIAALLIASRRTADPVAIHYSQASLRAEWIREQRPRGEAWVRRTNSQEATDNGFLKARGAWCRLIEDAGLQYNFVSTPQLEARELERGGYRVLVLPRSSALSKAEADAVRRFAWNGGLVLAEGETAVFDEHVKRLTRPQLADIFAGTSYGRGRAMTAERAKAAAAIRGWVKPPVEVTDAAGRAVTGVETHTFRNGDVTILALLTNLELHTGALGPPEERAAGPAPRVRPLKVRLPAESWVYDVRAGRPHGRLREIAVPLDPFEPAIFAISATALPELRVTAPQRLARGETATVRLALGTATPAAAHILHMEAIGPDGKAVPHYSGNLQAPGGRATWHLPLAWNDAAGTWTIRVRDMLSGHAASVSIAVR